MNFKIKEQKIKFYPESKLIKEVVPPPQTVKTPKWFKDVPLYQKTTFYDINDRLIVENGSVNYGLKTCMPFLDSLTTGYSFNLWCDIQVKINSDGSPRITWSNTNELLSPVIARPIPENFPVPNGFSPLIFSWKSNWELNTQGVFLHINSPI